MFDNLKSIFEILTNKSSSAIYKTAFFLSFIIIGLLIDFSFNITHNYHLNNKLNQIEKINIIKKKYSNSPEKLKIINTIENEIFHSEHYLSFLNKKVRKYVKNNNHVNVSDDNISLSRSFIFMFLSSGSLFFILSIIRFTTGKGGHGTALDTSYLFFLSISLTLILYILPVIVKPIYNYLINFVIQLILVLFILRRMNR